MNRPRRLSPMLAVAVLLACGTGARVGLAQAGGASGIPARTRSSNSPQTDRQLIEDFVKANLDRAKGRDAKQAATGRDLIQAEMTAPNSNSIYKDLYGQILATQLSVLLGDNDVRVRMVGALVAGRAANALSKDNAQLSPAVVKALADKNIAVVLHGLKGAKGIIAYQATQGKSPIYSAVGAAVAAHATSGDIAHDASEAFGLQDLPKINSLSAAVAGQMSPAVMQMLDARAELYKKGGLPDGWDTDRDFLNFFSSTNFKVLPAPQQADVLQRGLDMVYALCAAATAAGGTSGEARNIQIATVNFGKGLYAIAATMNDAKMAGAPAVATATEFFRSASTNTPPSPADLEAGADKVLAALTAMKPFAGLTKPTIAAPTTEPSK